MIRIKKRCEDGCDECETRVIASFTTNRNNPIWDLTPYQGPGIGTPNAKWRLWERSYGLEYVVGNIDSDGTLVGLQSQFESSYYYDGYMELQQGCTNRCCDDYIYWCEDITWPS